MVCKVRTVLKKMLGRSSLGLQELEAVLCGSNGQFEAIDIHVPRCSRIISHIASTFLIGRPPTTLPEQTTLAAVTSSSSTCDNTLCRLCYRHKLGEGF